MHFDQLRYFSLVYETGSFALAGRQIPLSSQGVARSIRALEQELGKPLFSEGTLSPTPYADALYDFARKVAEGYVDLQIDFDAIDASQEHVIRLGFSLGMLDLIGTDSLERFKKLHPQIDFCFEEVVDERCDENLVSGLYDLAFTVGPLPPRVESVSLFSVPMTLWVNSKDPLAQASILSIDDLEGQRIATPAPGAKNVDRLTRLW